MFGDDCVNFRDGKNLSVTVDGVTATIDPETRVSTETSWNRNLVQISEPENWTNWNLWRWVKDPEVVRRSGSSPSEKLGSLIHLHTGSLNRQRGHWESSSPGLTSEQSSLREVWTQCFCSDPVTSWTSRSEMFWSNGSINPKPYSFPFTLNLTNGLGPRTSHICVLTSDLWPPDCELHRRRVSAGDDGGRRPSAVRRPEPRLLTEPPPLFLVVTDWR